MLDTFQAYNWILMNIWEQTCHVSKHRPAISELDKLYVLFPRLLISIATPFFNYLPIYQLQWYFLFSSFVNIFECKRKVLSWLSFARGLGQSRLENMCYYKSKNMIKLRWYWYRDLIFISLCNTTKLVKLPELRKTIVVTWYQSL